MPYIAIKHVFKYVKIFKLSIKRGFLRKCRK